MDAVDYEGYKFSKGSVAKVTDPLALEQALQININGKSFTVVMQTPGAEEELVRGLLYAEDVLRKDLAVQLEFSKNKHGIIELCNVVCDPQLLGKGYLNSRSLLSVSSCGICGKQEIGDLIPDESKLEESDSIEANAIFSMQQTMFEKQTLFKLTGGCHGVAAFDKFGNMLALYEDIGRHNALDKVVGRLILDDKLREAHVISFSGRISYEIVSKSFRAKIPIIVAVSAPSSLAVDFAKEFGLSLIAFARNSNFTIYSNPERIRF